MSKDKKQHEQILADAKAFKKEAQDYWQETFDRGHDDKEFVTVEGGQWDAAARAKRTAEGKPTLEFNLLRTFAMQQINTMRQNRPQIQVVPVDNGADTDIAKILGGLIKDTEEASNAEDATDQAAENAVLGGLGFIRLATDYVSDDSFNQEPRFVPIENPEAVLLDPLSKRLDGSDATKCLVVEWVKKSAVKAQYGEEATDFEIDGATDWENKPDDTVLIAEYFYKEDISDELLLLEDGSTAFKSELAKEWHEEDIESFTVESRPSKRTEIKWAKISGSKVLETGVFPGKFIPIVPVYGAVNWIGNERHVFSLIHFAKDPQRLFNYWKSAEAHILQKNQDDILAVEHEAIAGFEDEWLNPGKYGASRYRSRDENGTQYAAPQRIGAAQPPTGILNATATSQALISDTLNMHAPQMGRDVNSQSGRAIGLLQRQADTAHFHFQDNLNKSLRQCGRILVDLYPRLYDTPMVRRIIGMDGEEEMVKLNAQPETPDEMSKAIDGVLNNLSMGRYDVRIDTGPSFNTQREQSFQLLMQVAQFAPGVMQSAGDLIIKDSPLVNAKEIADRIKKTMLPQLLEDDPSVPPAVKAQMTQMQQQMQEQTQQMQQMAQQLQDKQADRDVKIREAEIAAESRILEAQINNSGRSDVEELRGIVELLKQNIDIANTPADWRTQGEDVGSYDVNQSQDYPQPMEFEQPIVPAQDIESPPSEGFLMPEQNALPNFAPDPDQIGESALIDENLAFMPNGDGQNDV